MTKFLVLSDIHLEILKHVKQHTIYTLKNNLKKICLDTHLHKIKLPYSPNTNLLLCGDIGNPFQPLYWNFLRDCSLKFRKVFFIHGNHEYYNTDQHNTMLEIENVTVNNLNILKLDNLIYLNNTTYIDTDYKFKIIGTTLWSFIPNYVYTRTRIRQTINDYNKIFINDNRKIDIDDVNKLHIKNIKFLEKEIKNSIINTIVMTHHLPSYTLVSDKYKNDIYRETNHAYYSDLDYMFNINNKLKMWCCGHTHTATDTVYKNTRIVINPVGYPGENDIVSLKEIDVK